MRRQWWVLKRSFMLRQTDFGQCTGWLAGWLARVLPVRAGVTPHSHCRCHTFMKTHHTLVTTHHVDGCKTHGSGTAPEQSEALRMEYVYVKL